MNWPQSQLAIITEEKRGLVVVTLSYTEFTVGDCGHVEHVKTGRNVIIGNIFYLNF